MKRGTEFRHKGEGIVKGPRWSQAFRRFVAVNRDEEICKMRRGRWTICNTPLGSRVVDGQTVPFCATCDRKFRGICLKCDDPVYGRKGWATYCDLHNKLARHAAGERWTAENLDKRRAQQRVQKRKGYEAHRERKRLWEMLSPERFRKTSTRDYLKHKEKRIAAARARTVARGGKRKPLILEKRCRTEGCTGPVTRHKTYCATCIETRRAFARQRLIELGSLVA